MFYRTLIIASILLLHGMVAMAQSDEPVTLEALEDISQYGPDDCSFEKLRPAIAEELARRDANSIWHKFFTHFHGSNILGTSAFRGGAINDRYEETHSFKDPTLVFYLGKDEATIEVEATTTAVSKIVQDQSTVLSLRMRDDDLLTADDTFLPTYKITFQRYIQWEDDGFGRKHAVYANCYVTAGPTNLIPTDTPRFSVRYSLYPLGSMNFLLYDENSKRKFGTTFAKWVKGITDFDMLTVDLDHSKIPSKKNLF